MSAADKLRELHEAATPGPWKIEREALDGSGRLTRWVSASEDGESLYDDDADLVVALRNATPALIALIEVAQKAADVIEDHWVEAELRTALAAVHDALGEV